MKTFKKFLNEASGFPTGPVGENPNNLAGEVTDTLGTDMSNPENRMWLLDQMENFFNNEDYEKPAGFKPLD